MTDRVNALCVALSSDVREDDVQKLADAIMAMRGVASVTKNVADINAHVGEVRARLDLAERLADFLRTSK